MNGIIKLNNIYGISSSEEINKLKKIEIEKSKKKICLKT